MVRYLLRRLATAIPTLWLIATAVFLLSKLMPGAYGSAQLQQSDHGYYSKADAAEREQMYRQYLKTTGQDLALFYISIRSAAVPDTLRHIPWETDRQLLHTLALRHGQPELVTSFYKALKKVEQGLDPETLRNAQNELQQVYRHQDAQAFDEALEGVFRHTPNDLLSATQLPAHAAALQRASTNYRFLLPAVAWHGAQNQYHSWLTGLLRTGGLGTSLRDSRPVFTVLSEAIANTWWLLMSSMAVASLLAMELSLLMVRRTGRRWRKALLPSLFVIDSIPLFVLAMLLLVLLASPAFLQVFPVYGMGYSGTQQTTLQALSEWLRYMALPLFTLVLGNLPYLTNQFYQAISTVAGQDYIRTAYAKGLSESSVIRGHMLRNALLPIITLLSDFLPALVGGAVIIETVFAIPGVGRLLLESVLARDYPVIVGIVLVAALFRMLAHLAADLFYTQADPRLKNSAA